MTSLDIAHQRLHNEHLIGAPFKKPEDVVQWLGAVQAQDYAGAKWAIGRRVKNCVDADVEQAYVSGKILRTHVMRPTWHFVIPADIRWMQELTAPRVNAVSAYYYRKLELDDTVFKRSNGTLTKALQGGKQRTRAELARVLKEAGITANGLRLAYILMRAELDALICSGALRGKQHTYALLDDRVPKATTLKRDEAVAELTKRYFTSHGPALAQDFAWWSGLAMADAKAGIEMTRPHLLHEVIGDKTYWFASSTATARVKDPTIHLLPNYDEYLIAYKDHNPSFNASLHADSAALYDILAGHIVVLNSQVIGGWRRTIKKNEVSVETKLLVPLNEAQKTALHAAAEHYGRFLGMPITLRFSNSHRQSRSAGRPSPSMGRLLYVKTRKQWRAWLSRHHGSAREVWLVYYRKHTGKARIPYNDAVEEALCYGWIDSTVHPVDEERFAQRFTPRNPKSRWSEMNKERVRRLIRQGKMTAAGLAKVNDALDVATRGGKAGPTGRGRLILAPDIARTLQRDKSAWERFQKFPASYKRIRIGWIEAARTRPEAFRQRLRYFVKMTAQNKRFGMVQ